MNTEALLKFMIDIAEKFKAEDLTALQVSHVCDFADYFLIMSGSSTIHVQSLAEEIHLKCKHAGRPVLSLEGVTTGEWCLLDFGDVVVHVFLPEKRAHYDLEGLWSQSVTVYPAGAADESRDEADSATRDDAAP